MASKHLFTHNELQGLKKDIQLFSTQIETLSRKNSFNCKDRDLSFFVFLGKHAVFYKYLALQQPDPFLSRVISDIFYLIRSLICGDTRYTYLHERSLIESFVKFVTSAKRPSYMHQLLDQFKKDTDMLDADFCLIKSEYKTACDYVHGGTVVDNKLSQILGDSFDKAPLSENELNAYYSRIQRLFTIFDRTLIRLYPDFINSSFYRKKSLLEYLIGAKQKELLQKHLIELSDQ